jgi:UDP-3-O-[3-hydroxymyristoyl] glucosamine N-acyltransferase
LLTVPQFAVKLVTVTLLAAVATGAEGVGNGVGVGVNVAVAVGVAVGDGVGVGVNVAVAVGVGVGEGLGAGVGRGLGVAERLPSTIRPHAPAAKHAIAMSRLIPRKKGLGVMLEELVSLSYYGSGESKFRKFPDFF